VSPGKKRKAGEKERSTRRGKGKGKAKIVLGSRTA